MPYLELSLDGPTIRQDTDDPRPLSCIRFFVMQNRGTAGNSGDNGDVGEKRKVYQVIYNLRITVDFSNLPKYMAERVGIDAIGTATFVAP